MVTQWKPALQSIPFRDKVLFGIHANGAEYRRLLTQQEKKKELYIALWEHGKSIRKVLK